MPLTTADHTDADSGQRNYRKKLKRRLEDLEKKAASTSPSPELSHAELAVPTVSSKGSSVSHESSLHQQSSRLSRSSSSCSTDQPSPDMFPLEDPFANVTMQEQQMAYQLSPPTYAYASFPPSSDYFVQDPLSSHFPQTPQIYSEPQFHGDYMHSLPPTLPCMSFPDGVKQDAYFTDDDFLNPFGISYANLAGMEVPSHQIPAGYSARVNTTDFFPCHYSRTT